MAENLPLTSYVTLSEADDYHDQRASFEAWNGLDEQTKERRLMSASDFLDSAYTFKGEKADPLQFRQFPRAGQENIPLAVKYAVCELALQGELNQNAEQKMASVRVGPLSVNYADSHADTAPSGRFEYVKSLLNGYLKPRQGGTEILRG